MKVTAIQTYLNKQGDKWPEKKVSIPRKGLSVEKFLQKVDPVLTQMDYWLEDSKCHKITNVKPDIQTVWIKSKVWCEVILAYKERKANGDWPEMNVRLPRNGYDKVSLLRKVDSSLNPEDYTIEDAQSVGIQLVTPGVSVVWIKYAVQIKVICQYVDKVKGQWPQKFLDVPYKGMSVEEFFKAMDPGLQFWKFRVEDIRCKTVNRVTRAHRTVWVKRSNTCLVIKTYCGKDQDTFPETTVDVPDEGISAAKLLAAVSPILTVQQYFVEDSKKKHVDFINPGTSTVWIKEINAPAHTNPSQARNYSGEHRRVEAAYTQHPASNAQFTRRRSSAHSSMDQREDGSPSAKPTPALRRSNAQGSITPRMDATSDGNHHVVTAIQTYLPKDGDLWPEFRVTVPSGRKMQLGEFLHAVDPTLSVADYWLEDSKCLRLDHVPEPGSGSCPMVWIKSKVWCEVIQAYLSKKENGDWPEVNVRLPPQGYDKATLLSKIDDTISADDYIIEDAQSNQVTRVDPGLSVVWVKRAGQIKVICQHLPKTARCKWTEKCVEVPEEGQDITTFFQMLDPELDCSCYRVENRTCRVLDKITREERMVWVKQNTTCLVIQTYLPKREGVYPEITFELPKFGYTVGEFLKFVDSSISPETHYAEDSRRRKLEKIRPGISTIWIKRRIRQGVSSTSFKPPVSRTVEESTVSLAPLSLVPVPKPPSEEIDTDIYSPPPPPAGEPTPSPPLPVEPVVDDKPPEVTLSLQPQKVFISYHNASQKQIIALQKLLQEKYSIPCCVDTSRFGGGQTFRKEVEACMRSAEVVLCCVTPSYLKKQNCLAEATLSLELGKTMVVAQMENMQWPPRDLLYIFFDDNQRVNIVDWLENKKIASIEKLAQKVKQCLKANSSKQTKATVQKTQDDEKSGGSVQQWSGKQVVQWVCNLGAAYEDYGKKFEANSIDGKFLKEMDQKDLSDLGIQSRLHQKKFLREIQKLE